MRLLATITRRNNRSRHLSELIECTADAKDISTGNVTQKGE
jgi:hypothetical protein